MPVVIGNAEYPDHIIEDLEKEYKVYVNDTNIGKLKSSLSGKISFSIELDAGETAKVQIVK